MFKRWFQKLTHSERRRENEIGKEEKINIEGKNGTWKKRIHTFRCMQCMAEKIARERKQTLAASNNIIHVNIPCMVRNVVRALSGFRFSIYTNGSFSPFHFISFRFTLFVCSAIRLILYFLLRLLLYPFGADSK